MNIVGERVKAIRKAKKLTLEEFGKKVGLGRSAMSNIETAARNVTDQMSLSICREFGVNEEWLRTGEGEMFLKRTREDDIAALFDDIATDNQSFRSRLISVLAKLPPEHWVLLEQMAEKLLAEMGPKSEEPTPPAEPSAPSKPVKDMSREKLHAELDRQLDLEEKAKDESGAS